MLKKSLQKSLWNLSRFNSSYNTLLVSVNNKVGTIKLNRPKQLNALCDELIKELNTALNQFDKNDEVSAIILTGSEKAFAAGADISEMKDQTFESVHKTKMFQSWDEISKIRKPIIAAVNGFSLGGGCELAMMCDIIIAGDNAKFGQPEIKLGTIPGCGGTQRLVKAVGKSKAMELILTGEMMDAHEAKSLGLVSRVVEKDKLLEEAQKMAEKIAAFSQPIVAIAKDCVNQSMNLGLDDGVHYEKQAFYSTFATHDRKEGMKAFIEKRKPDFKNQ